MLSLRVLLISVAFLTIGLLGLVSSLVYDALIVAQRIPQTKSQLSFAPTFSAPVAMHYEATTVRYGMEGSEEDEEFAKLLPSGGHTVHVSSDSGPIKTYTVMLFHQLKCLDIIRREYGESYPSTPELTQHCLTYLQQTILCRPYLALEVTKNAAATARKSREMVCRDWEAVYSEAEKNRQAYLAGSNE